MRALSLFVLAAVLEIGGGYLVWLWLREGRAAVLGAIGFVALAAYGTVPVLQAAEHPFGRVYAAYGAIFIALSALWGGLVDHRQPDARDWAGITLCVAGALVMMSPRATPPTP